MRRFYCPKEEKYYEEPEGATNCVVCGGPLIKVEKGKEHGVFGRERKF